MPFIFIDRRKAGRGKSSNNRQKLIRRVKGFIKQSLPSNIGHGTVAGHGGAPSSPVLVAGKALEEPSFVYARRSGESTVILPGNDQFDRGDEIDLSSEEGGTGGGPGAAGEDDFIVHVARDEFLDLFFEDCELPDLVNEKWTERTDNTQQPAGFSTTGNPSQLSIIRTYKQALARRWALTVPHTEEIAELEEQLRVLDEGGPGTEHLSVEEREVKMAELVALIERAKARREAIAGSFDKVDLRYRKKDPKPLKTVDAVLIMVMDISGSMDAERKTIARRWFALLYAFIKRRYASTELVFIAHTDEAIEMSEGDFFSTRINGGTSVSPALKLVNKIISERYDPNQTNIYISHASDGDNWDDDGEAVIDEMLSGGRLLSKIQLFSYVEVGKPYQTWYPSSASTGSGHEDTNLWEAYQFVQNSEMTPKLPMAIIETPDECYPIFKKIFKKRSK